MTDIQVDDSGTWRDIRYQSYEIEFGLSDVLLAPKATVQSDAREDIDAGQRLRIRESGSTIFEGRTTSSGKRRNNGRRRVEVEHRAFELFDETVSFIETSPTAGDVLQRALDESSIGASFTLTFAATDVLLADDYEADDRTVKRVFRDMTDRAGLVWWVDGVDDEITVDEYGARGVWESINTQTDSASVLEFDPDSIDTVVNDVTVNGTGGERVTGSASDSGSISEFGRRPKTLNVSYIQSATEADDYADALLQPDPLPEADVQIGRRVGDVFENLANFEIDITDPSTGLDDTLVVEKQTVSQGSAEVALGQGRAVQIEQFNRSEKSKGDTTEPGSVYGGDRIADDSIDDGKLVDLSVTEDKLADLAVSIDKLQDNAVVEGKLADFSVSETKVADDAISTPKLQAEAVTANEIEADTITASQIESGTITTFEIAADTIVAFNIDAGTITATEIAAGTLTANEIDVLDLDAGQITVGDFTFGTTTEGTALEPTSNGVGVLGTTSNRLNVVNSVNADFEATFTDNLTIETDSSDPIVTSSGAEGTNLIPDNAGTCLVGTTSNQFEAVVANNLIEATPEPLSGVDASDITGYSWDKPPEYVAQRKAGANADEDYRYANPNDGIGLGHMVNYLFEVCKDQQRTIDLLADRLETLEAAVDTSE